MDKLLSTEFKSGLSVPLVFLHGFLGNATDWEAVCSLLPSCACIGFDLPGHGRTEFRETFEIDIDRFHLIGYSMGGRIAMAYAASHPGKIASLTLISAHPGLSSEEEKLQKLESDAKWAKKLLELPIDDFLTQWYEQKIFCSFKPDLTKRRKQNPAALAAALMHYSLGRQPLFDLSGAHVLVGERDEKFRMLLPNAEIVPNASHAAHLENPKAVASAIARNIWRN